MTEFFVRFAANVAAIVFVSYGFSGIRVASFGDALLAGLLLGFVNAFIKPVLFFLTLPFTILTLGFFTLVVNALSLKIVDWMLPGFEVEGFLTALFGALTISVVSTVITAFALTFDRDDLGRW
ncbi:MAG: phage holin family protein [Deltaproteobacteria bacterium]|nr:MAG: phage holin family protein [Deltaproteobacteria bacterium]